MINKSIFTKVIICVMVAVMTLTVPQSVFADQNYTGYQWYLYGKSEAGEVHSPGINYGSYKLRRVEDETVVVAVIDSGVDYTHPDLQNQMWINPYPEVLKGTYGYDFADDDTDPMDEQGHGTHVAGTIAATHNDYGIDGIADAKIMALKIANTSVVVPDAIVEAFEYVYQAMKCGVNIKAINCSWSNMMGYSYKYQADYSTLLKDYIDKLGELGALTIFAAGNDCENCDNASTIPYSITSPYIVVVGASDERDMPAYFSAYGKKKVDLYAPGTNVLATTSLDINNLNNQVMYANDFEGNETSIKPYLISEELQIRTATELEIPCAYKTRVKYKVDPDNTNNTLLIMDMERKSQIPEDCTYHELEAAYVFVDVTDLNLQPDTCYILMTRIGVIREGGAIEWDMNPLNGQPIWRIEVLPERDNLFAEKNGRTYLRIIGISDSMYYRYMDSNGIAQFCFDDFSLVRQEWVDRLVERYGYSSGTSMAAPMVSGAVALLSTANPKANALQLRDALMSSIRRVEGLEKFCKSGGILDLSMATAPISQYKTIKFRRATRTMSYQKYWGEWIDLGKKEVGKGILSPTITYTSSNTKYARVSKRGRIMVKRAGRGHTVTITVRSNNGSRDVVSKIKIKITK